MEWRNIGVEQFPTVASAKRTAVQRLQIRVSLAIALTFAACSMPAHAQDGDAIETLDVTMQLLPEGATLPDAVTRVIELPPAARDAAADDAARGLNTANAARSADNPGRDNAAEARERGREHAQEVRENVGRGRPDEAPGNGPPDGVPGPPAAGGPPADLPATPGPPDGVDPPGQDGAPGNAGN